MESQILNEQIEWEMRRVAAAFGLEYWDIVGCSIELHDVRFGRRLGRWEIYHILNLAGGWQVTVADATPDSDSDERQLYFNIQSSHASIIVDYSVSLQSQEGWILSEESREAGLILARGVFRLGVPLETLESELAPELGMEPLFSAHEELELRLSMPREFWPQQWLGEEALKAFPTEPEAWNPKF